jgi:hypothetical protein
MLNNSTTNQILCSALINFQDYPAIIRPYLVKAHTHPILRNAFTKAGMRVLIDILSRAPIADLRRSIKVRLGNVAKATQTSEKTVQRVLDALLAHGWVARAHHCDGRNWLGRFCAKEYVVKNELREMIGLPIEQQMSDGENLNRSNSRYLSTNSVDNSVNKTEMSDGVYVNKDVKDDLKEAFTKENLKPETRAAIEGGIPHDLISLQTDLKLSKGGICALMALAKKFGKRLQDIWAAKKETIIKSGATAGRAYRYLMKLIQNVSLGKKFFPCGNTSLDKNDVRLFWYKRYIGPCGEIVKIFDGIAEVSKFGEYKTIPSAAMAPIYEGIRAGKLNLILN